jgi:Asp-tRNA(Asn)/Glu-tRNA(Gln) amidotransferase A subunit family amidase
MHIETDSFLGPTVNPHNRALTCGGSSGGEGALVGAGASAIGVGSDIGGSIRAPAAVSGIYGFKVTSVRLPVGGFEASFCGQESILPATGPMARSARDMELFIACVLGREPWRVDNSVVRMPWRPEEVAWAGGKAKPRIGVMWDDGLVTPQPPTRRALAAAVDKLKAAGFDIVDFTPYKSAQALGMLVPLYFTDGGDSLRRDLALSGEPAHPMTSSVIDSTKRLSMEELWAGVVGRETFRDEFAAHWNAAGVDVVLCPPSYGPAQKVGSTTYWNYTCYWNCK